MDDLDRRLKKCVRSLENDGDKVCCNICERTVVKERIETVENVDRDDAMYCSLGSIRRTQTAQTQFFQHVVLAARV